jgi:hypothetical protein
MGCGICQIQQKHRSGNPHEGNPSFILLNVPTIIGENPVHKPDTKYDRKLQSLGIVDDHKGHAFLVVSILLLE